MAEGSETPGGGSGSGAQPGGLGPEGRGRGTEGDLLAERRARRAVESGDAALIRRAEAAEATVRTLEAHLSSLQQRLREAEAEQRRLSAHHDAEQAPPAIERRPSGEQELRRARQREYAEQQLRLEAEDRSIDLERESRLEIERLGRRLSTSERDARILSRELEAVQRELAETEQAAAAELASARRVEKEFQARLAELERRTLSLHEDLKAERAARMLSEQLLERMRLGYRRLLGVVGELRGVVARLSAATATAPSPVELAAARPLREDPVGRRPDVPVAAWSGSPSAHREEMTEALAAAVERLRARVEDVGGDAGQPPASAQQAERASGGAAPDGLAAPGAKGPPHRHTMSWLRRRSIRRKERRARRAAAAGPPSMQSQ